MNVGVIGTGNIGSGLGRRWALNGHMVMFGSRTPEKAHQLAEAVGVNAMGGSVAEAAAFGDALLLAVPWRAVPGTLRAMGALDGKTLIDCTNPLGPDGELVIGGAASAGEEVQRLAPDAKVIKAFNTVFARVIHGNTLLTGQRPTVFFCGDADVAKGRVAVLIQAADFEPIDAGPLRMARILEPLALLVIELAHDMGMGNNIALKLLQ